MRYTISASIVTYCNDQDILKRTISSFLEGNDSDSKLYIIDNSPTNSLGSGIDDNMRCEYIFNGQNLGFGRGHNIALRKASSESKYHLVLNPDIYFGKETIPSLIDFMNKNAEVGLILPRVLDFNFEVQYACKRLPSPVDLIVRRLSVSFLNRLFGKRLQYYEMREKNYNESFEAPSLSGCFMFLRVDALEKAGFFDERFFMYMEDVDLSRRIHAYYKTLYYPKVDIFHGHARESYKINKLLFIHVVSAIKYFNKWGWFLDNKRKAINKKV